MRVKLQLVMCSDKGEEETVTEVITRNKNNERIEHLGLTLAEAKQLLSTLRSGLQRFTPRAQSVPAYAQVLRHSSMTLSRRPHITWWRVLSAHRKPPAVRICRLSIQSAVGTRPPSTSTPQWPACWARH